MQQSQLQCTRGSARQNIKQCVVKQQTMCNKQRQHRAVVVHYCRQNVMREKLANNPQQAAGSAVRSHSGIAAKRQGNLLS
ncbi:hypothetical protein ACFX2I_014810 [Malus domestica]